MCAVAYMGEGVISAKLCLININLSLFLDKKKNNSSKEMSRDRGWIFLWAAFADLP